MTTKTFLTKFFFIVFFIILFTSCLKKPNHTIRIQNHYIVAISDIKINTTSYGRIEKDGITKYIHVEEGDFLIKGTMDNGSPLLGRGYVTGKGDHKWTLTLCHNGKLTFSDDTKK